MKRRVRFEGFAGTTSLTSRRVNRFRKRLHARRETSGRVDSAPDEVHSQRGDFFDSEDDNFDPKTTRNAMLNESRQKTPKELGFGTQSPTIFIEDVEGHFEHAKSAGVIIVEDLHETEYGELQYGAEDLDGHHWLCSRHSRDVRPEQWGATVSRGAIREDS